MRAYSLDLREKVVAAVERGDSTIEEVAAGVGVGQTFVKKMLRQHRETGDLSPIEQCWSKIKTLLRAAKAHTREELEKVLAAAIGQVTKSDIRGWFKHCGYRVASA